jgi:hypothetical protein
MFKRLRSDSNPRLRLIALRAGIVDGDCEALMDIERQLPTLTPEAKGAITWEIGNSHVNTAPPAVHSCFAAISHRLAGR